MLAALDKLIKAVYNVVLAVIIAIGLVMLVVAWAHVFCRYVLNDSLTWSEELLKILLVWFCLLSTTIIAVQREHVSIVVFKEMMPHSANRTLTFVSQILMLAASVIVMLIGIDFVNVAGSRMTPALRIPYRYTYSAIPVSFAILSLYELRNTIADFVKGPKFAIDVKPKD
ncbi:TRAP transporter small permease [Cloacibacillus sp. An23]|uniref:TRAP transporter small permease n=1 Tax=Cloacibacillus sp. An23 TaxID=1965591 RepID=UPI000B37CD96|nr:TRAP transporter small permease [Cloacibacillus sp. An23]OUO91148.1 TRAP transporter permease DctQ [Cloacibacillus sp. An23]